MSTLSHSGTLYARGNLPLTVLRASAGVAAGQTDSVLAAGVAGYRIRVISLFCLAAAATTLTFNSKGVGAGVAITPAMANGANGGAVLPVNEHGWFETSAGEALTCTTGAGGTTALLLCYVLVPDGA